MTAETNSQSTVSSSKGHSSSSIKNGNSSTIKSTVNNSKTTSVSNSSNATSSDKTEVTETVNSENVATDNSAAETASNDNANISLESETGFEQRFQRIAVGESFNAATVFGSGVSNVKVINSNIASASGTTITAKAFGRTQVVGTVNGEMSIIELEVRTSSSDVAAPMVAAGGGHTVALKKDGTVWTWGNNGVGQLGDGTSVTKAYPVQVFAGEENDSSTGYLNNIIQISAGSNYVMALKKDGTVFTWGQNIYGQLGNGSSVNSMLPVQVKSADGNSFLTDIVQISAGYVHSMALKKDGTVLAWGRNDGGQLGNNKTSNKSLPVQVKGGASGSEYLTDVVQVTAGNWHSMALKANGTVYAWGWGQYGQLGNGYTTNSYDSDQYIGEKIYSAPVQVLNGAQTSETGYLKEVVQIDAMGGTGHDDRNRFGTSLAVTESKEVYGWGNSLYGALGVKSSIVSTPVRVATGISTAVQVAGGGKSGSDDWHVNSIGNTGYTYILKEDGTVSSLGYNVNGELGNGAKVSTTAVQEVSNLTKIMQVAGSKNGNFGCSGKGRRNSLDMGC